MLCQLSDTDINRFIEEDAPYGDLTTLLLGIGALEGKINFSTRETTTSAARRRLPVFWNIAEQR
jgi:molybdenum transport protein